MSVLEFKDIHRAYKRGVTVLGGVSFSLAPGQVVGLLGRNGAGKTTLIRIAMGMLETQKGSVRVLGMDPREKPIEVKRRVGYVSEDQILPAFMAVGDVIRLHRGLYPTWDEGMERELMNRFSIDPRARIKNLSKGQARQVALLCAVSHRPELLLLDEPAGGLDPLARQEFLETAIQLLNQSGTTILFSSHQMTDVERMAQRVVLIHQGKVLIDSELDDLREGYSLALIPPSSDVSREQLMTLDGCLGVRERNGSLHAIIRLDPAGAAAALERGTGIAGIRCTPVALEEMFIELVGGQS
jgi:ABC-2 type transport system ATP-binding protein